jgi:hypothetical protein
MRQIKLETVANFIHYFDRNTIEQFAYDGKRGYASLEYAIGCIDMYSISFLGNALLNKLMLDVVFKVYESIFILFSLRVNKMSLMEREKSFISKAEARGWSEKRFGMKRILFLISGMA